MARRSKYSPEFRERSIRVARESERPITQVAHDLGIHPETLRVWVRQDEADDGTRTNRLTTAEREDLAVLRRENRDLRRSNEILKAASVFRSRTRPAPSEVSAFVDTHRGRFGGRADVSGDRGVRLRIPRQTYQAAVGTCRSRRVPARRDQARAR